MAQINQRLLLAGVLIGGSLLGIACAPRSPRQGESDRAPVVQPTAGEVPSTSRSTQAVSDSSLEPTPAETATTADGPTTATAPATAEAPTTQPTTAEAQATQPTSDPVVDTIPPAPVTPNAALADRLREVAQDVLRDERVTDASWRMARSMLEAARRLDPDQPQYARDLIEAQLRLGDTDAAIATLSDYRQLVPGDEAAQVRQIDLFLNGFETVDQSIQYLSRLVETGSIPQPVRSAAAVRLYYLRLERAESQEAQAALDQALELNPLNLDAIRLRYANLATTQPAEGEPPMAVQRLALLLAMMRSNPAQPIVAEDLARELADAGLVQQALEQYQLAFALYRATSVLPSQEAAVDYAAEFFLNDDTKSADALAAQLLEADPTNTEAWFLRMLLARADSDSKRLAALQAQTGIALGNRLAEILKEAGDTSATTRPVTIPPAAGATTGGADPLAAPADPLAAPADPLAAPAAPATADAASLPDPAAALQRVQQANRPELIDAFASVASDIAWLHIFFQQRGGSDVQPWIDAFKAANADATVLITRLEGWSFLAAGNAAEAQVKLSAIAERDPLAAMGVIKIESQSKEQSAQDELKERGNALLARYPVSLLGATLYETLKPLGAKVAPNETGEALLAEFDRTPREAMNILDRPQAFYALRAEPVKGSHLFGEPVQVRVGIQNVGKIPLTIGPDGVIRSDLWFDAQFRGALKNVFSGVAYDQIVGPLVLQPGEGTSQVVKVNQGALRAALESNPIASIQFMTSVITNPSSAGGDEQIIAGPAGQRVTMTRLTERSGMPVHMESARQGLLAVTAEGEPAQKVQALDLIASLIVTLQKPGDAPPPVNAAEGAPVDQTPQIISQLREALRKATFDTDENVRAWALFQTGFVATPEQQPTTVKRLAGGKTWQERMLAALLVQRTGSGQEAIVPLAESDPEEMVRRYASSLLDYLASASTQPATAPATVPATQ